MRYIFTLLFIYWGGTALFAQQITVSGTVLDKGKINYVEAVKVITTSGKMAYTDSLGRYKILATAGDSIFFVYNNKPTLKFAVSSIANTEQFDIAIQVPVKSKYGVLQEVVLYSKSYRQDSADNRANYADVFDFRKQGIQTSVVPGGGVGLDLNGLINVFRFKRNKRLKAFQARLEGDEKEKYIDYRFNKNTVKRITQLKPPALDTFLKLYRPTFEFVLNANEIAFTQYVLNSLYHFQKTSNYSVEEGKQMITPKSGE